MTSLPRALSALIILAAFSASAAPDSAAPANAACTVKGNINEKGERIYHLPGDQWYAKTKLDPSRGERWFCSEKEARAAGWRSPSAACAIKGNVGEKDERIYYSPGDALYERTKVDPGKGERWFCSETEALAAGWRGPKK